MGTKRPKSEIVLVPPDVFKKALKKVLSNTKQDSDKQLAEFQSSNVRKRQAKKRG